MSASTLSFFVIAYLATNTANLSTIPHKIILSSQAPATEEEKEYRTVVLPHTNRVSVSIEQITKCRITVSSTISFKNDKFPESLFDFLIEAGFKEEWSNPFGYIPDPTGTIPAAEQIWCVVVFSRERKHLFVNLYMPYGILKQRQLLTFGDLQVLYWPDQQLIKSATLKKTSLLSYPDFFSSNLVIVQIGGVCTKTTLPDFYMSIYPKGTNLQQAWNFPQHTVRITQLSAEKPSFEYRITCSSSVAFFSKLIDTCVHAVTVQKQFALNGLRPIDQYEDETSITTILEPTVITLELQPNQ